MHEREMPKKLFGKCCLCVLSLFILVSAFSCGDQAVDEGDEPGDGDEADSPTLMVIYDDKQHEVALANAETVDLEGKPHARLQSVVRLALPDEDIETLYYDFVASDGFKPTDSPFCPELIPISGSFIDRAYIDHVSLRMVWDEALDFPGCMSVKSLAEIIVTNEE